MKTKRRSKPESVKVGNVVVKVYHRKVVNKSNGRPYEFYQLSDYTTGVRRLLSISDHEEAVETAERIARQLSTGQAQAAAMTNSQAASYGRAMELLRPTGVALEIAVAAFAKAFTILGGDRIVEAANYFHQHGAGSITRRTVAEVITELVEQKQKRGKSKRYIADLRARCKRFAKSFVVDVDSVTTADVQKWLDKLQLAPRTARNFRGALSALFSFAEARGYVGKGMNPVPASERIDDNGDGAIEIYTPTELFSLLQKASARFRPFLLLGAFAGLRSAEIERLQWEDVDLTGRFIHVAADKAKTRSRRLVPITDNLALWLAHSPKRGPVWSGTPRDLLDDRAATCKAAKVAWKHNALRHSFISYRLAVIQDAAKTALEAGNSPAMVFKHYRELVKPAAAATWFAIAPEAPGNVISLKTAKV